MTLRQWLPAALLAILPCAATAQSRQTTAPAAADSTSAALAVFIGGVVDGTLADHARMGFDVDRAAFISCLADYLSGKPAGMDANEAKDYLNRLYASMQPAEPEPLAPADAQAQTEFVAAAASRPGARVLPTGTVVEVLKEGTGAAPQEDGIVEMRYRGVFADGRVFDEVPPEEAPLDFPVAALTPGLIEALTSGMRSGGIYRVTLPPDAAYGAQGIPGSIPPGAALEFTIDLISAE